MRALGFVAIVARATGVELASLRRVELRVDGERGVRVERLRHEVCGRGPDPPDQLGVGLGLGQEIEDGRILTQHFISASYFIEI